MYKIGTRIWPRAGRTSQQRMARRRADNTSGRTVEIAPRISLRSEGAAPLPTRRSFNQKLDRKFNRPKRIRCIARCEAANRRRPVTGLQTNPAQITRAFRLGGFLAAHRMARGVENDSARRTKGSDEGMAEPT